jgi:hypothetical protein
MHADRFAEIVAPLEVAAAAGLTGPSRVLCLQAFEENADGFRRCAERARQRAQRNPVGLLVRMVKDGDHRFAATGRNESERSQLERALRWAETAGRKFGPEHVFDIADASFTLDATERAQVRDAIARSLEAAA